MDYLVRGINGSIPTLSEVRTESRNVVAIAGFEHSVSPASLRYGEKMHEEYVKAHAAGENAESRDSAEEGGGDQR